MLCHTYFHSIEMRSFLFCQLQLIVAISDPPKKQDTPKPPINFRPSSLPGMRAPQPRRFAIAISPNNSKQIIQNADPVSDRTKFEQNWFLSILRNVLRIQKEDAATTSSLRTMAETQFDEYITQVDDLMQHYITKLDAAEKENETLSQLLQLAVHQKLTVNERLQKMKM